MIFSGSATLGSNSNGGLFGITRPYLRMILSENRYPFFGIMRYDSKAAQHRGSSWMPKVKIARSRASLRMAVPPVQRSVTEASAAARFAIIGGSDYGFGRNHAGHDAA
jgi:hypothetical protein